MKTPVALVTGGTRGIGLGIARALAAEGWSLALCGLRSADEVARVVDDLKADGAPEVAYWTADVSSREDRGRLIGALQARFAGLDALVNNAGKAPAVRADVLDASEESFEDLVRTNLQGPYFLTQAAARLMLGGGTEVPPARGPVPPARGPGTEVPPAEGPGTEVPPAQGPRTEVPPAQQAARAGGASAPPLSLGHPPAFRRGIVFVTSVSAELASLNRGDYCVSKAGLAMAAQLYALRLAPHGIPVYEVRPGIVATDMTAKVKAVYDQRIADGLVPEARWGSPQDVGRTVAALLRGDVPYATGSVIHVAGGLQIGRL